MRSNRRRFLALVTTAGTVTLAGCGGGDSGNGDDGSGGNGDGGDDTQNGGNSGNGDGGATTEGDEDSSTTDDGNTVGGDTDDGEMVTTEEVQPSDITGTAESSVEELEVVRHEVTDVTARQIQVDLELRNAGDQTVGLATHNFVVELFEADGTDVLRDQGSRGPENDTAPGETGVVEFVLVPQPETNPASYEITVNCDVQASMFNYCESE